MSELAVYSWLSSVSVLAYLWVLIVYKWWTPNVRAMTQATQAHVRCATENPLKRCAPCTSEYIALVRATRRQLACAYAHPPSASLCR